MPEQASLLRSRVDSSRRTAAKNSFLGLQLAPIFRGLWGAIATVKHRSSFPIPGQPMVTLDQISDFSDEIVRHFDPDKIVLFGSYAYGKPNEDSDVDLLIVMPFEGRAQDVRRLLRRKISAPFSTDVLIRTSEDTARRYREFDPLIRESLDKGIVLYERNCGRMDRQIGDRLPSSRTGVDG